MNTRSLLTRSRLLPLAVPAGLVAALLGASVALACHASTISGTCSSTGKSISGMVTSTDPISTTITLDLQYQVGSTWTTYNTTTATFSSSVSGGKAASYTMPFSLHTGATAYRVIYDGRNSAIANTSPPAAYQFTSCSGVTAAAFSRISVRLVGAQHVMRWFSAQHVLGFNVFAGSHQLNNHLVTSSSHWYAFATTHSTAGVHIVAVLADGANR